MLLAIAFAHAPLFVTNVGLGPVALNAITEFFHVLFVSNHARPMFAFLFGYALVQLLNRQTGRGADWVSARKLLRRRGWWLAVIGFAHMVLLVPIDILAVYGVAGILVAGMLRAKDSTVLWVAGLSLVPATLLVGASMWFAMVREVSTHTAGSVAAGARGPLELLIDRLQAWPVGLVAGVIMVVPGVLFGVWAARRRILEEPVRHRTFLIRATLIMTALSLAGSLPVALIQADVWADPSAGALWAAAIAQPLTGYFGAMAMAGIVALLTPWVTRRDNRLTTALQAMGQRSMSLYLLQSVVFIAIFYPYGLGLQDNLGLVGATGVAIATWLLSLVVADFMRRAGYRGPAEILLRRLTYR